MRWASTWRDSSLTGNGSTYNSSPPKTVSGVDWGKIFLTHNFTTQEMSLACACKSWSGNTGVWIPEELVDFFGVAPPEKSCPAPPGDAGKGLLLVKPESSSFPELWLAGFPDVRSVLSFDWSGGSVALETCVLAETGGLGGWMMWLISISGGCILAIEPRHVRQATLTFGSEIENLYSTLTAPIAGNKIYVCKVSNNDLSKLYHIEKSNTRG